MQQLLVILIFLAAVGYLGWRALVSLRRPAQGGCGKGCGCGAPEKSVTARKPAALGENIGT